MANQTKESVQWYTNLIRSMGEFSRNEKKLVDSGFGSLETQLEVGSLYLYFYDPKLKEILPMYDKFPLTTPIEAYADSFLGLNLHYLPLDVRTNMFSAIKRISGSKIDEKSKLAATYSMVNGISRLEPLKNCVKKYLYSHLQSKFLKISPTYWDTAIRLPVAQFRKGRPY
jgi:hypothetical protein